MKKKRNHNLYFNNHITLIYDTTANTNIHHQTGNTVDSFLPTPNGRIRPCSPKATSGFKYRNPATKKR